MSLKSFLSKTWLEIESLFNSLPADLQNAAHIAVTVTKNFKTFADSPGADILALAIDGAAGDKVVTYLRSRLPTILQDLRLVGETIDSETDGQTVIKAAGVIQSLTGDIQNAFLHDLAVLILREIISIYTEGLSWADAVYVIEWCYQYKFKKKAGSTT